MNLAIRRFIYVFNPSHQQEETTFPRTSALNREDFIWLVAKAANLNPLGYLLAQFVWLHSGALSELTSQFDIRESFLEQELEAFFVTIEQLTITEESDDNE